MFPDCFQISQGGDFGIRDGDFVFAGGRVRQCRFGRLAEETGFDVIQMAFRKWGEAATDVGVFEYAPGTLHVVVGAFGKGLILTCA